MPALDGPEWPVVQPARPVTVRAPKAPRRAGGLEGWKTACILPDAQIGFRSGDPFHDDEAIEVALQIVEAERPDVVVWLGDLLDLPAQGKYRQDPAWAGETQAALDRAHEVLAITADLAPDVRLLEGNHEARLANYILDNAAAAHGLTRAKAPQEWPVMTLPHLLRLDELGIEYIGGYPAGATYLNDSIACIHGHVVNSAGSTASRVINKEHTSVVFGHVHRIETQYKTRNLRGGYRTIMAHTPGCLTRIDGAVPSSKGGTHQGKPVRHFEDWQQGMCVVRFHKDGRFLLEQVHIQDGWASHRGREYAANRLKEAA